MAEPVAKPARRVPGDSPPPSADDFPGCREVWIPSAEIEDYDGRIEYWDARNEAAFIAEPTTTYHEYGTRRLTRLMALIAMRRGAAITVVGSADLVVREKGRHRRVMQADESVYLRTADAPEDPWIEAGVHCLPDVVLEVDYSTDARRYKLGVYESWGFPEVWIEVPDIRWRHRPGNRPSALTIHVLEGGRYVTGAFKPGVSGLERRGDPRGAERERAVRGDRRERAPRGRCARRRRRHGPRRRSTAAPGTGRRAPRPRAKNGSRGVRRTLSLDHAWPAVVARRSEPGAGRGRADPSGMGMPRRGRLPAPRVGGTRRDALRSVHAAAVRTSASFALEQVQEARLVRVEQGRDPRDPRANALACLHELA